MYYLVTISFIDYLDSEIEHVNNTFRDYLILKNESGNIHQVSTYIYRSITFYCFAVCR